MHTPSLTVFTTTWNVGEKKPPPPDQLAKWIPGGAHIYAIALQECKKSKDDWLRAIAAAVGSGTKVLHQTVLWGISITIAARDYLVPRITNIQVGVSRCRWCDVHKTLNKSLQYTPP